MRGATIYTGSEKATDAESARLADRENKADAAAGADQGDGPGDVADILQELTLRETRGFSARFAKGLFTRLSGVMEMSAKPPRGRLPGAALARRALGAGRARLPVEQARPRPPALRRVAAHHVTGQMAEAIEAFFAARLPPAVARGTEAPRIGKAAQIAP